MNNDASKLIGKWRTEKGGHITFKSDGTFEATIFRDNTQGTYSLSVGTGGNIIMTSTGYILNIISKTSKRMVVNGGDGEFVLYRSSGISIFPLVIAVIVLSLLFADSGRAEGVAQIPGIIAGVAILVLIGLIVYRIIKKVIWIFR